MAATVRHGAMDTRYGLLVRHEDLSWHPYSSPASMTCEEVESTLTSAPYGLSRDHFRIVKWTALALCPAPDCKGHDDPDWQCPERIDVAPAPMLSDEPDDSDGPVTYRAC